MSILPQNIGDPIADAQRDTERVATRMEAERQANNAAILAAAQQQLGETLKVILGDTLINEMGRGYAEHTLKAYAGPKSRLFPRPSLHRNALPRGCLGELGGLCPARSARWRAAASPVKKSPAGRRAVVAHEGNACSVCRPTCRD